MKDILRSGIRIILFLSSYTFLFVILMIQNYNNLGLVYVLGSVVVVSNALLLFTLWRCRLLGDRFMMFEKLENKNEVNASYLVTYIIPFLGIDFLDIATLISLILLFTVIGYLYIHSDMIHVNPMLTLFGFSVIGAKLEGEDTVILITRKKTRAHISKTKFTEVAPSLFIG